MSDRRPGLVPAVVVAAGVLFLGIAFIRLSAQHRIAQRRALASQVAFEASYAIEKRLEHLCAGVESLAMEYSQGGKPGTTVSSESVSQKDVIPQQSLFFVPAKQKQSQLAVRPATAQEVSLVDWEPPSKLGGWARRTELLDPVRSDIGEWVVIARSPLFLTTPSGATDFAGWLAASVVVEDYLLPGNVELLTRSSFNYELGFVVPNSPTLRVVSRSTQGEFQDPVRQAVRADQRNWSLHVEPKEGWIPWPPIVSQAVLIAVLALFGAVWVYDFARRPVQLRAEVEARDRRLRDVHQRWSEEIEQREELEKKFSRASVHDALTGLPNRSHFMERMGRALQRTRLRPGYVIAVIVLNFDRFKNINESMGTAVGDELLTQAVPRLQKYLRPEDWMIARLAGDEFALLLFDIGSPEAAAAAAKRLQEALAEPFQIDKQSVFTTASMGIALSSSGYENAEELMRGAHIALSKAKADGRAQFAIFDPATREQIVSRQQLETDLHLALERREFSLNFQPIVSLETGCISGMEALVRWNHPLEGTISPGRFIPLAEETGLVVPLTRWVLREACEQARRWYDSFPKDIGFYFSVNLSAQDLRQPDMCDYVAQVLKETGLPPGVLRLEVTESMMIGNINAVSELVSRFREMRVPLLLDDFGTGYSSLSYLNRFQFDYIKIDQAFVRQSAAGTQSPGIVKAIVHMAQDLGSKTIAEGVETIQNLEQLQALGCNYGQGYHFSKPLTKDLAEKLLLSRPIWRTQSVLQTPCQI